MKILMQELQDSKKFLEIILDSITSAVFIVDKSMKIYEINDSFKTLFHKKDDQILGKLCGNALSCEYAVRENALCGTTKNCMDCCLRKAIEETFRRKKTIYRRKIIREFFIKNKFQKKYLQFTTKLIKYKNSEMVMIILDDITDSELSKLKLKERNDLIEKQNLKMKEELKLAKTVQQSIIPFDLPKIQNLKFHAIYHPLEEVGGDIYDILELDEDNIGVFVSDISGHGVSAAMITAMVKALIETYKKRAKDPSKLMKFLNEKLLALNGNKFITAFYGVYNKKSKNLKYVRCGHPYPLLIRNFEILNIQGRGSMVLGVFEEAEFFENSIKLQEKDKLLIYTDGFLETKNKFGVEFEEIIPQILQKNTKTEIRKLTEKLYQKLIEFTFDFKDDICILGMEILKNSN